ncbi:glycoside hydrolase family 65 protein [Planococcus sp. CAU13]|uniref:glycoside hydrolase family 65 protein n=1 Tax=Planococcus sp. CAU13 TaxID=1541197 RepID=UPI00052FE9C3|nr:glycosyl hydrolase family 65 protein [Planococcus sp. CAU13]
MLDYSMGQGKYKDWILAEQAFSADHLGKSEAVMVLGNGYMGLRSANEEPYLKEKRNLFINGTFNQADNNEVTELPNAADMTRLDIRVDGERFSLEFGEVEEYFKQLNLKDAELIRSFIWTSPKGKKLQFRFSRFVSLDHLHLIGMKLEITNLMKAVTLTVDSGINAQMANTGVQHFRDGGQRIAESRYMQLTQTTTQTEIDFVHNAVHTLKLNNETITGEAGRNMERRRVWMTFTAELPPNGTFEMEKLATVHTSRDKEWEERPFSLPQLQQSSLAELKELEEKGYEKLVEAHHKAWQELVWDKRDIAIESEDPQDQLVLRSAIYHLAAMAPAHDDRMGIGAKALSGEIYKGHSFWDTEIFILPPFIYSKPSMARSLLTYRYRGLAGARQKAAENGYAGAMYPWEAAWPTDGEVTPAWGDIDIVTGEQTKIWSGFIEQHISADIAFAVDQYVNVTGDGEFLMRYGYEIVFETARFWSSRFEWNERLRRYEMTDVIGPDEYKEHVSNNAFTNCMAYYNLKLAMRYAERLAKENPELRQKLLQGDDYEDWQQKSDRLYLPEPRGPDGILPQDDTYLELPEIDLEKYRKQKKVRSIYKDYNPEQINGMQVSKQADVVLLFYLVEQTFLKDDPRFADHAKRANFFYYEARTLHDSSLSLATHVIGASDIEERQLAYSLFKKACDIDLGPNRESSDDGIHAAAMGGIWKAAVFGFAGVRQRDGTLAINPRIPEQWKRMHFTIHWQGELLELDITQELLKITSTGGKPIGLESGGRLYELADTLEIPLPAMDLSNL